MVLDPELVALVHSGVACCVASRDADSTPAFARAFGPEVLADGAALRLLVDASPGSRMRANLEDNGAIAVGFNPPVIARALQIKGVASLVREPVAAELERAERHFVAFCEQGARVGVAEHLLRRIYVATLPGLLSVSFPIADVFDQTPGASAGQRV